MKSPRIAYLCEEWFSRLPKVLSKPGIAILSTAIAASGAGCGLERNRCSGQPQRECCTDSTAKPAVKQTQSAFQSQPSTLQSSLDIVSIEETPNSIHRMTAEPVEAATTAPVRRSQSFARNRPTAPVSMDKPVAQSAPRESANLAPPTTGPISIPIAHRPAAVNADPAVPTENDPSNPRNMDRPSEIPPPSPAYAQACFPTMIYKGASVAVTVPDEDSFTISEKIEASKIDKRRFPVRSVLLVKAGGKEANAVDWKPVASGRAAFQNLSTGTYNVYYSTAKVPTESAAFDTQLKGMIQLCQVPDRKLLVETIDVPIQTAALPWEQPNSNVAVASLGRNMRPATMGRSRMEGSGIRLASGVTDSALENNGFKKPAPFVLSAATEVLGQMAKEHGEAGWGYLEKGSLFNARQSFVASLKVLGSKEFGHSLAENLSGGAAPQYPMVDILEANEGLLNELRRGTASTQAIAARMADYVGNLPQMSHIVYGLGKTYDAISKDPAGLMPGSEYLAQVCYLAANMVAPEHLAAVNDLAALLHRTGNTDIARAELLRAAQLGVNPRIAGNLGIVLAHLDRPADAMDCLEWALERDPTDMQSLRAWLRLRLSPNAPAIYADECHLIGQRLVRFITDVDRRTEDGRWAICEFEYLRIVGREAAINMPSLMSKVWLKPIGEHFEQMSVTVPMTNPIDDIAPKRLDSTPVPQASETLLRLPSNDAPTENASARASAALGEWRTAPQKSKGSQDRSDSAGERPTSAVPSRKSNTNPVLMPELPPQREDVK